MAPKFRNGQKVRVVRDIPLEHVGGTQSTLSAGTVLEVSRYARVGIFVVHEGGNPRNHEEEILLLNESVLEAI